MRRLLLTLGLLACACAVMAARPVAARQAARPFDSFGEIQISDMLARLDNFAVELQNVPEARGFIVVYARPNRLPGWPLRRANLAVGYLTQARGLDAERVRVVNGGYQDEVRFELWILPRGVDVPAQPFDLAAALALEKTPFLYDQFEVFDDEPGAEYGYDEYLTTKGRYEPFVTALRADPAARGCIIGYATRSNRRGEDRRLATRRKKAIMLTHAVGADRLVAIGGGLREDKTVELWIVPPGSALPKPTPTVRPARRRRR